MDDLIYYKQILAPVGAEIRRQFSKRVRKYV